MHALAAVFSTHIRTGGFLLRGKENAPRCFRPCQPIGWDAQQTIRLITQAHGDTFNHWRAGDFGFTIAVGVIRIWRKHMCIAGGGIPPCIHVPNF